MNWDMIGATGEWAGAIAVVATLIYRSSTPGLRPGRTRSNGVPNGR